MIMSNVADVAGEVPNLFPADEKAEILERVQNTAREEGRWHIKLNFKKSYSAHSIFSFFNVLKAFSTFMSVLGG